MVAVSDGRDAVAWVLLSYRVPREPSTPRIAVWRRLRRLGVAQLGDGLVALPEDARTREHLEWIADEVEAAGGTAMLWRAQTLAAQDERQVARAMTAGRADEFARLAEQARTARSLPYTDQVRQLRRLRRELRQAKRRDYFPPVERDQASTAVDELAAAVREADARLGDTHEPAAALDPASATEGWP